MCRLCVIAGDISPIDVITHVPVLCEEADVPYIYVPSREVIGAITQNTRYVVLASLSQLPLKLSKIMEHPYEYVKYVLKRGIFISISEIPPACWPKIFI
jgi:ribosomal protein L7Ae-like RNA K-turn-binding protein